LQDNHKISDPTLIDAIRRSDHFAFDQLFHKYGPMLYAFVVSILKDEPESEEVVQDIFLKIWEKRKELQPGLSFKSYLFTIAYNATKKIYRQKLLDNKYKQEAAVAMGQNSSSDLSVFEYRNLLDYVDTVIDRLPPARREIFIMSKKDGLKNEEIASILKISEQTVKNQLVAARKFLIAETKKDNNGRGVLFFSLFLKT
jgi:RNA polymerase sigma-70 factor (ECF subfamily)